MTADAPSAPEPPAGKPRRMLGLWIGAFGFLGLVAAFCWLVLGPYLEVREAIRRTLYDDEAPGATIERLGGPRAAARKLSLYSRLPDRFAAAKQAAAYLMGFCDSEAVPRLVELLNSRNPSIRKTAIISLGQTNDQRAVEPLIAALDDPVPGVGQPAACSLGELGGDRAIQALIGALGSHKFATVREQAAVTLGRAGNRRALEPLVAALRDKHLAVCANAADALGRLGDARAIPALEALAASGTPADVAGAARKAIAMIRAAEGPAPPDRGKTRKTEPGGR